MTSEEIYKDRDKFAGHVQEVAQNDLQQLGLEIKVFTIRDFSDINGYFESLGKKRTAEVIRDAKIATANAEKETMAKTAEAMRDGETAKLQAETMVAEAHKEKELKVQAYNQSELTAKATRTSSSKRD